MLASSELENLAPYQRCCKMIACEGLAVLKMRCIKKSILRFGEPVLVLYTWADRCRHIVFRPW